MNKKERYYDRLETWIGLAGTICLADLSQHKAYIENCRLAEKTIEQTFDSLEENNHFEFNECLVCGYLIERMTCNNCNAHQGAEFLEQEMELGECEKCGKWKKSCECN